MNRIEIIATFMALRELEENKQYESMRKVIDAVLAEAMTESKKPKKDNDEE